jgi:hypothetical protein
MSTTTSPTPAIRRAFLRALVLAALGLGLGVTPACDDPEVEDADAEISLRGGEGEGGPTFNTNIIVTSALPAFDTKGGDLDGVELVSVVIFDGGVPVTVDADSLRVDLGTIEGEIYGGTQIEGVDFLDSVWTFTVDGTTVQMTLADIETGSSAGLDNPNDELHILRLDPDRLVYTFHYGQAPNFVKTCAYDSVAGARAVLYGDIYVDHRSGDISDRDNTIYFGCISGAVGKSALHGYAPDNPSTQSVTVEEFELAVRAIRADYCGNGTSYTNVGNPLTYNDRYGINGHTQVGFVTEALWETGAGATCVNRIRSTGNVPFYGLDCGDHTIYSCGSEATAKSTWFFGSDELWTKIPN